IYILLPNPFPRIKISYVWIVDTHVESNVRVRFTQARKCLEQQSSALALLCFAHMDVLEGLTALPLRTNISALVGIYPARNFMDRDCDSIFAQCITTPIRSRKNHI